MEEKEMIKKINKLKKEKGAVILVHNYQRPEIYEVADFIGDSYELAKKAKEVKENTIVFCGVDFMAETAKILNPKKIVLHPVPDSGCPMADMVTAKELKAFKQKYPGAAVVSYVNTNASTKAESTVCVTSANALKVVKALKQDKIIFVPDKNLGGYVASQTKKEIILWPGFCCVHEHINPTTIMRAKQGYKDAMVMVHPECRAEIVDLADAVCSTSQMITYAKESLAKEFIVVTEQGMVNRLQREIPNKKFYPLGGVCGQMKKITLESVLEALEKNQHEIKLDPKVEEGARKALELMLEYGK